MMLFLEMAAADGEFTDAELATVFEAASNFTDHDVEQFVQNALRVAKTLSFEERVAYLGAGLAYFAGSFAFKQKIVCQSKLKIEKSRKIPNLGCIRGTTAYRVSLP